MTRVAMLSAIPGVTKRCAARIVVEYPTFGEILEAGVGRIMNLRVTKHTTVNVERARAVIYAIK